MYTTFIPSAAWSAMEVEDGALGPRQAHDPDSPQTPLAAANRMLSLLLSASAPTQMSRIPLHEVRAPNKEALGKGCVPGYITPCT